MAIHPLPHEAALPKHGASPSYYALGNCVKKAERRVESREYRV
jgi:hypothetical protein